MFQSALLSERTMNENKAEGFQEALSLNRITPNWHSYRFVGG